MIDTLKGIIIALLLIIALIILLVVFNDIDASVTNPEPGNGNSNSGGSGSNTVAVQPPNEETEYNGEDDDTGNMQMNYDDNSEHVFYRGRLELPVMGATGWAASNLTLRSEARSSSSSVVNLSPGDAFTIFDEVEGWWFVILPNEVSGWVEINRCFINLPDVIPSIIYNISNAVSSEFRSSGYDMPGITHNSLYSAYSYNERLERGEFIVPGSYGLAITLSAIQQLVLANGDTLIVFEVFRPMETQRTVAATLNRMMNINSADYNEAASRAIAQSPWSIGNFISQGRSNHQLGAAIDVTIGIVEEFEIVRTGDFSHRRVKYYSRV